MFRELGIGLGVCGIVFGVGLSNAGAQTTRPSDPIIVSANRIELPASQIGTSTSVIMGATIEAKQQPFVADVLRDVPGLDVRRSGGPGQQAAVLIRGAASEHTLVMIDGVPSNDPASPAGAFNFATLTTDNIERIEVLRGPQSTVWGSQAMGGVINVITKRGQVGPPKFFYEQEYGSFATFREAVGVSGGTKFINYSLSMSELDSHGISAADKNLGNSENDAFSIFTGSGKIGLNVSENFDIDFIFRAQNSVTDFDKGGGPPGFFSGDDEDLRLYVETEMVRVQPRLLLFDGAVEQVWGFSVNHTRRRDNDPSFGVVDEGTLMKLDLQNNIRLGQRNTLTIGGDYTDDTFEADPRGTFATAIESVSAEDTGLFIQDLWRPIDDLTLTAGYRYDDHSRAGSAHTYRLTGAYLLQPTQTTFRSSYGTGFKAPSMFQLFSAYGSPTLEPEEVKGWDAGFEQQIIKDRLSAGATWFHNDYTNLISFVSTSTPPFGMYQNVNSARTQGVEAFIAARPCSCVSLRLAYTYTEVNADILQGLVRRPLHKGSFNVTWQFLKNADASLEVDYVGARLDVDPVAFGATTLDDYVLVNLASSWRINEHAKLFARVENLFDQDYQEVAGYGTPGLSAYIGFRIEN